MSVKQNKRTLLRTEAIARIAPKFKDLRARLGIKQTDFAAACGVSSVQISRWEHKLDLPGPKALVAIAKLAPDDERGWWLQEAGVGLEPEVEDDDRKIPVLRDPAAAGTTRVIRDGEIAYTLSLPRQLVPRGGKLFGLTIEGDSMSPILETGYLALVDVTARNAASLEGKMVAAKDGDGVTIKWLRKHGKDMYLLVPQHTSPRHQVQVMQAAGDWSIVGEVVNWIGFPPPSPPKGRQNG